MRLNDECSHLYNSPLYQGADARDRVIFDGLDYQFPETFLHGRWHTVVKIPKARPDGDGQDCEIQECRMPNPVMPARFFRLIVKPGRDSTEADSTEYVHPGWILSTGSGDEVGHVLVSVAKMVSQGMIGWEAYGDKIQGENNG